MGRVFLAVGIGLFTLGASAQDRTATGTTGTAPAPLATASLIDAKGRNVGGAQLQQTSHGVLLKLDLRNVTPGVHALHIHEYGRCDPPAFDSAGEHFSPSGRQHGFLNPRGPHAGDLPNIEVPATQELWAEYLVPDVTLAPGPRSLLDGDGSAIVIHTGKDDHLTDPAGDAGDRLACGAIARAETLRR